MMFTGTDSSYCVVLFVCCNRVHEIVTFRWHTGTVTFWWRFVQEHTLVGRPNAQTQQDIQLSGLGIMPEHAIVDLENHDVFVTPLEGARLVSASVSFPSLLLFTFSFRFHPFFLSLPLVLFFLNAIPFLSRFPLCVWNNNQTDYENIASYNFKDVKKKTYTTLDFKRESSQHELVYPEDGHWSEQRRSASRRRAVRTKACNEGASTSVGR